MKSAEIMRTKFKTILALMLAGAAFTVVARDRWTPDQANAWYAKQPWLVGCNFGPSTAINQLEMWQAESWDPKTIDRELGWAEGLGFTSVRVFLHNLLWQQDSDGFLRRMDEFLGLADKHHIGVMFVPLDGCWDPFPKLGKQRDPKPHVHNSGWAQSPGREILSDPTRQDALKPYIVGVISHFRNDRRVQVWDIFNEPDNPNTSAYGKFELPNKAEVATQLLKKAFVWAREANPSQPVTAGVWMGTWGDPAKFNPMEKVMFDESDVISFHNYAPLAEVKECVKNLRRFNRPILCTEYMARPRESTFDPILQYFKDERVAAYNWGFVAGKTQTIYPWDSWTKTYTAEPDVLFHDIFRPNGTPLVPAEVKYIKSVTGKH
jgi:hypothetical protein